MTLRTYEITTNEPWSDKAGSGLTRLRFRSPDGLARILGSTNNDFLVGEFSELDSLKGVAKWTPFREGAIQFGNIARMIEITEKE